jgi:hypothetical protein
MDALVNAGALADDKLVADLRVQKVWHQHPGLDVTIDYAPRKDAFGLMAIAREQSPYWLSRYRSASRLTASAPSSAATAATTK